jgi:hypothetical protein
MSGARRPDYGRQQSAGVGKIVGGATQGVQNTLGGAVGGLGQTLGDTTGALGRGDALGAVGGVTSGLGKTVGGVGKGLVSTYLLLLVSFSSVFSYSAVLFLLDSLRFISLFYHPPSGPAKQV